MAQIHIAALTEAVVELSTRMGKKPVVVGDRAGFVANYLLFGYFTSEIGCTQAQRYVESPGRFDPCAPYAPGEKSWAPHA